MAKRILAFLLAVWRLLPQWVHVFGARALRPRFRVGVVAMIFDELGRVLLLRHTYRKFDWGLPAGGLEYGEDPQAAVLREFCEETGLQIQIERMIMALSSREDHHVSLIYSCRIVGGHFRPSLEVSEMRYFDIGQLPRMLLAEKELIRMLADRVERQVSSELA